MVTAVIRANRVLRIWGGGWCDEEEPSSTGDYTAAVVGREPNMQPHHVHLIRIYIRVKPLIPALVGVVLETEQQHVRLHPLHNLPRNMDIRTCSIDSVSRGFVLFSVRGSI